MLSSMMETIADRLQYIDFQERTLPKPQKVVANKQIVKDILSYFGEKVEVIDSPYKLTTVSKNSNKYEEIKDLFYGSSSNGMHIRKIQRIWNPYTLAQHLLKTEYKKKTGVVQRCYQFHSTATKNLDSICTENFNWRLTVTHKFGQGVCFSHCANYASIFPRYTYSKVMLLSRVVYQRLCVGHKDMVIPILGCDGSKRPDGYVVVKYDDHEFYPEYIIHYYRMK